MAGGPQRQPYYDIQLVVAPGVFKSTLPIQRIRKFNFRERGPRGILCLSLAEAFRGSWKAEKRGRRRRRREKRERSTRRTHGRRMQTRGEHASDVGYT